MHEVASASWLTHELPKSNFRSREQQKRTFVSLPGIEVLPHPSQKTGLIRGGRRRGACALTASPSVNIFKICLCTKLRLLPGFHMSYLKVISAVGNSKKKTFVSLPGIEPGISGSVDRRLIHWATDPAIVVRLIARCDVGRVLHELQGDILQMCIISQCWV